MVTRQVVRIPIPERSRRRGEEGTGVDAGAICKSMQSVPTGQSKPNPLEVKVELWARYRRQEPRRKDITRHIPYGIERRAKREQLQYGC